MMVVIETVKYLFACSKKTINPTSGSNLRQKVDAFWPLSRREQVLPMCFLISRTALLTLSAGLKIGGIDQFIHGYAHVESSADGADFSTRESD
ncbi:hypothetical protein GV818_05080 [Pseudomonas sp. Fl4BN1]|nr:hypothetical protein [Pseudomonas sp. Fl4BN1]